jgi:hypothetical protein
VEGMKEKRKGERKKKGWRRKNEREEEGRMRY